MAPSELEVFNQALQLKAARKPFVMATVVRAVAPTSARCGDKALLTPPGMLSGWVGGSCAEPIVRDEAEAALVDGLPRLVRITPDTDSVLERAGLTVHRMTCFSGGELDIYLEPHLPPPTLVVIGTSPIARALVELGRVMKYEVGLIDSAAGLLHDAAFEPATTAMVVSTHGTFDDEALEWAARFTPSYLGLVASPRRRTQVLGALKAKGVDDEVLAHVHAPAGIDLGARTPEEIALTIFAELVAQRRGKVVPKAVNAVSAPAAARLPPFEPAMLEVGALDAPPAELAAPKACCHAKAAQRVEPPLPLPLPAAELPQAT